MKKADVVFSLLMLFGLAVAPAKALARDCELPHERLQAKCGGEYPDTASESDTAVSAVQKSAKTPLSVVSEYRERSQRSTEMVEQAISEYKAYLSAKQR